MAITHDPTYLRTWAPFVYGLFVQGLETWWTTDESGDMLGSVVSGLTDRTCKGGLVVPETITESSHLRTGWIQSSISTFRLLDYDLSVATLFGSGDPDPSTLKTLAKPIAAGTTPITSVTIQGAGTLSAFDPSDHYVGIERFGPAGERNYFSPFNFSIPGLYHPAAGNEFTPRLTISPTPLVFEGRRVALYRFYREDRLTGAARFGSFVDAELAWIGILTDRAEIMGDRMWSLSAYGWEGYLKRELNSTTQTYSDDESSDDRWFAIDTKVALAADERDIGVVFYTQQAKSISKTAYKSSVFAPGNQLTANQSRADLWTEIGAVVSNVANDSSGNITHADTLSEWLIDPPVQGDSGYNGVSVQLGRVGIQVRRFNTSERFGAVGLLLHHKVWLAGGWDPWVQSVVGIYEKVTDVTFYGSVDWPVELDFWNVHGLAIEPRDGYWYAVFTTVPISEGAASTRPDNASAMRFYDAAFPSGISIVDLEGRQEISLAGESPYIEGQIGAEPQDGSASVGGSPVDSSRLFAMRGKYLPPGSSDKPQDTIQVFRGSWANVDGHLGETTEGLPGLYIEKFYDPRAFGFPYPRLSQRSLWLAIDRGHEIVPLATLDYVQNDGAETRFALLVRLLLSTGTASWVTSPTDALTMGVNSISPPSGSWYADDAEIASLGLAVPRQLVDSVENIEDGFAKADPDGDARGVMQRVRIAWIGALNSEDLFDAITAPVGIGYRLHGAKFGVYPMFIEPTPEDADLVIMESDLGSFKPPTHGRKLVGQYHRVKLRYRFNPEQGSTALTRTDPARDAGALTRPGNLEHTVTDYGLLPTPWYDTVKRQVNITGVGSWHLAWRRLWGEIIARFYAQQNFTISGLHIARPKGIDVRLGTVIRLSNPWPQNPKTGGYGFTEAVGRVISVDRKRSGEAICDVLIYGNSLTSTRGTYYAPIAKVVGYNPATNQLKIEPDWRRHGNSRSDLVGFLKPAWSTATGTMEVRLYRFNRFSWSLTTDTPNVTAVDEVNGLLTLDGALSDYLQDEDHFVVPAIYGAQTEWPQDLYGVICLDDGTFGASNTPGKRWIDA